jgi:hypothetical protein
MARELPSSFVTFAMTAGFSFPEKWSPQAIEKFKDNWSKIVGMKGAGHDVLWSVFHLLDAMTVEDDAFRRESGFSGVSRLSSQKDQRVRVLVLYPQIAESTVKKKKKKPKSGIVQIGLGLASTYKPRSLDRFSVVIDENTKPSKPLDKGIIYTPGWSIDGAFDDKS